MAKGGEYPPIALLALFVWLLVPSNVLGDPIAIGTGTVTLDYTKTSDPAAPVSNTFVLSKLSTPIASETCIAFGNTDWGGSKVLSQVEWSVTIVPGIYEMEFTYGTGSYGVKPLVSVYDGASKVTDIYSAPSGQGGNGWKGQVDYSPAPMDVDLQSLTAGKTYTIRITDERDGGYGLCVGHISFTPKVGVVMAAFGQSAQYGPSTLPENGSNTINDITVTSNMSFDYTGGTYDYLFSNESTDYVDISVGDDQVMTSLATSVLYDGSCTGGLYIKFSSSATFDEDALVGTPILLSGLVFDNFYTYPPSTSSVSLPSGIIKSARIYRNGSCQYGTRLYRIKVEAEADECIKKTASFEKEGTETGSAPNEIEACGDGSITIPGKGSLSKTGNVFAGWDDGSDTYQEGDSYDMNGSNHTFTAVWNPITVPAVTDLTIVEAIDKTVPLSYIIPGICDLSKGTDPIYVPSNNQPSQPNYGTLTSHTYNAEEDYVTANGSSPIYGQYGIGFNIPATDDLSWLSYEWKGTHDNISLCATACNSSNAYWDASSYPTNLNNNTDFTPQGPYTLKNTWWNGSMPASAPEVSQIVIFANAGAAENNVSFSVRNVRYHVAGQEDIDHVVIVRKDGVDPENPTDGTVLYNGTKSFYVDEDNSKEFGHTYHYAVFAVHADGTVSNPTITTHTVVATATCEVSFNIGEGAIGDAPTSVNKPANGTVTLPSIGSAYKPFYAFTGWKKNNAGDLLAAGSTYTVTAADVEAETISFTAQWQEDNTTRHIPAEHVLNHSNQSTSVATTDYWDVTDDQINDVCLDMRQKTAEWKVFIKPGYYDISTICAVPIWGISYRLSIVDPVTDLQVKELFYEKTSGDDSHAIIRNLSKRFDLTDLAYGKQYIIRIKDTWENCGLLVHDININPVTPEEIASEVVLDAGNTVTTGLTEVTDVDFPGDNDQSVNLYNKKMDWVVKIAKGYYNISLLYGAPEFSTRVSVALIDPEGVEPTRWFCPDQTDRNGHYYHTSGVAGTQYYSIGLDKRDLYDIDPEKTYIVRVHDENGSSNSLRVKDLTFTPIAPLNIPAVTRLNAANAVVSPGTENVTIDGEGTVECLDIAGLKEAAWYAYIAPGIYDIKLTYAAATGGTKVRFGIIDIASGDTVFVKQENKYGASNTTYTISTLSHDFTTIGGGVYKIIVKDNYTSNGVPSNGSVPQVAHLDIERTLLTHTRSGLRIGDYGTICLPYAVAEENIQGAEVYEMEGWPAGSVAVVLNQINGGMEAGHPYIYQATANTATFSYYVDGEEAEAGTHNGLVGSYTKEEITPNANNYIIYNNKLYYVNSLAYVGVNKAYINRSLAETVQSIPAPAPGKKQVRIPMNNNSITDIDQVIGGDSENTKMIINGHLFIFCGDKTYNAQGQLIK